MTVYRFTVESADPEVDVGANVPLWDHRPLFDVLGSFHEWMNTQLTHEQRVAIRFTLELESGG